MTPRALAWGQQLIVAALRKFRACMRAGIWPGYGAGIMPLELPGWAEFQLADREAAGEFTERPSAEAARRSMEWWSRRIMPIVNFMPVKRDGAHVIITAYGFPAAANIQPDQTRARPSRPQGQASHA